MQNPTSCGDAFLLLSASLFSFDVSAYFRMDLAVDSPLLRVFLDSELKQVGIYTLCHQCYRSFLQWHRATTSCLL